MLPISPVTQWPRELKWRKNIQDLFLLLPEAGGMGVGVVNGLVRTESCSNLLFIEIVLFKIISYFADQKRFLREIDEKVEEANEIVSTKLERHN